MSTSRLPRPPNVQDLVGPFLQALPAAAVSNIPPAELVALLTPILRARVEYLSSSNAGPWLRLLCYDTIKGDKLENIARSSAFEPHPVSGEVEVEWDDNGPIRYRRFDEETLQAAVSLKELELLFKLQWEGGDDGAAAVFGGESKAVGHGGWSVAEVTATEGDATLAAFGGFPSIEAAEEGFATAQGRRPAASAQETTTAGAGVAANETEDDDDDDYWGRYDESASTPAPKPQGPPPVLTRGVTNESARQAAEDAYFAQYDSVQPAMDRDDPDGHADLAVASTTSPPPLKPRDPEDFVFEPVVIPPTQQTADDDSPWVNIGDRVQRPTGRPMSLGEEDASPWSSDSSHRRARSDSLAVEEGARARGRRETDASELEHPHPRPSSSAGSSGSHTVALLEESARARGEGEFGVRQHVSRSIRSLYLLARAAHIDRDEFEAIVRTELDLLGVLDDSPNVAKLTG